MNNRKMMFLAAAVLCFTAVVPATDAFAATEHEHKKGEAMYQCPMHPQIVSDKPGECPICHMRLVLIHRSYAGETPSVDGRISVAIQPAMREQIGIVTESVGSRPLVKRVDAWGVVAHDPELYELQIEFLREDRLNYERERDRTTLAQKRTLTGREKLRLKLLDKGLTKEWMDKLVEDGVPDERLVFHHTTKDVWVYLQIREEDASLVRKGDRVSLEATSSPGRRFEGRIEYVDGIVRDEDRTVRIRVLVSNAPEVRPMMSLSGTIEASLGSVLAIPDTAPLFTGTRALVFVDEKGMFTPREVTLGRSAGGYYEVIDGLMQGEIVASKGNFFIDSESRLRAALEGTTDHGSHAS